MAEEKQDAGENCKSNKDAVESRMREQLEKWEQREQQQRRKREQYTARRKRKEKRNDAKYAVRQRSEKEGRNGEQDDLPHGDLFPEHEGVEENLTYDDMLRSLRVKEENLVEFEAKFEDAVDELRWEKEGVKNMLLKEYHALLAEKGLPGAFWGDLGRQLGEHGEHCKFPEIWLYALAMRPIMLVMPVRRAELIDRATPLFKSLSTKDESLPPDYLTELRVYLQILEETLDELER
jgi:hypothetical protein